MLKRKYVGNLPYYFDKNFDDYKAGFASRGKNLEIELENAKSTASKLTN